MKISPISGFPAATRSAGVSSPCATAFLSRCSIGAVIFSSTARSISTRTPRNSKFAFLLRSFAACRTNREKRSLRLPSETSRAPIKPCCKSRFNRDCCNSAASASSRFLVSDCWSVTTSFKLSAINRVSSCMRENRSNSSGSNCSPCVWASLMRD